MPISNRNLAHGTTLTATFKKQVYTCTVVSGEDGEPAFRLADGRTFSSPSATGRAITGRVSCDGWKFWSVVGGASAPTASVSEPNIAVANNAPNGGEPKTERPPRAKSVQRAKLFKQVRKVPNQNGLAEGDARWFCSACMKGFVVSGGATPETCPEGHAREVVDDLDSPLAPVDASAD